MAAMSISALASFFADEPKSISRGENHYNYKQVESFEYTDSVMRGNIHSSMKSRTHKTTVGVKYCNRISSKVSSLKTCK